MDPDRRWEDIVGMADDLIQYESDSFGPEYSSHDAADMGQDLALKVSKLRDWLSNGGFMWRAFLDRHK